MSCQWKCLQSRQTRPELLGPATNPGQTRMEPAVRRINDWLATLPTRGVNTSSARRCNLM